MKTTTPDYCRLRANLPSSEERFSQAEMQGNISKELLRYLKQHNLSTGPLLPAMEEVQESMDDILSRNDLSNDEKAKRYFQLQGRYLSFKQQMNTPTV